MQNQYTVHPYYPEIRIPSFEEWKDINGYKGCYQISNWGRIKSLTRWVKSSRGNSWQKLSGKVLAPGGEKSHQVVNLSKEGIAKTFLVHHLVLQAFVCERPKNEEGCHNDGNFRNNRLENLRWDTHKNNQQDMQKHGTANFCKGSKHQNAILTEDQVREIKRMYKYRVCGYERLAKIFNISSGSIRAIVNGKGWIHVT